MKAKNGVEWACRRKKWRGIIRRGMKTSARMAASKAATARRRRCRLIFMRWVSGLLAGGHLPSSSRRLFRCICTWAQMNADCSIRRGGVENASPGQRRQQKQGVTAEESPAARRCNNAVALYRAIWQRRAMLPAPGGAPPRATAITCGGGASGIADICALFSWRRRSGTRCCTRCLLSCGTFAPLGTLACGWLYGTCLWLRGQALPRRMCRAYSTRLRALGGRLPLAGRRLLAVASGAASSVLVLLRTARFCCGVMLLCTPTYQRGGGRWRPQRLYGGRTGGRYRRKFGDESMEKIHRRDWVAARRG